MKCDCCSKKKGFLESFARITEKGNEINLCVKCNDLAYKVRDAKKENDETKYIKYLNEWDKCEKNSTDEYKNWKKSFLEKLLKK